jgi:glyoxylase-like metal-dependent hydrolase (beta-lactamase superfamily II)
LRELNFSSEGRDLKIGGFEAIDYFSDGSFYLLSTPGHALGHISALARTTSSPNESFAFLGADICHHGSAYRPSEIVPLPEQFVSQGRPERNTPYFTFPHTADGTGVVHNRADAVNSERHLEQFDADERIMVIVAHDGSLLPVLDVFPKSMNNWKETGWKTSGQWRFTADLKDAGPEF